MKLISQNTTRTVSLELSGANIEEIKGSWQTLDRLLQQQINGDIELTNSQINAIGFSMALLGLLS